MIINSYNFGVAIPTGNLVLYNRFNNSLTDETGNHLLSSSGISYTTGLYSGSASESILFNATTDYVLIPDSNDFSFGDGSTDSPFSMSFGIYFDSDSGDTNDFIINKRGNNGTGNANVDREWQIIRRVSNDALVITLYDDSAGAFIQRASTTALNDLTNYHITLTYDGSGTVGGIKIYIDGTLEVSYTDVTSGTYTAMENLSAPVVISSSGWQYTGAIFNELLGKLDGLGIWDKELSQEEVTAIYNKQSAGNEIL